MAMNAGAFEDDGRQSLSYWIPQHASGNRAVSTPPVSPGLSRYHTHRYILLHYATRLGNAVWSASNFK